MTIPQGELQSLAPPELAPRWQGPLFVVGVWRSGTSLLYALLNKHPQIALLYEGDLPSLRPLFPASDFKTRWSARWEFWNAALSRHGLDASQITPKDSSFRASMEAAYRLYATQKGARIWGDKSPNYCDSLTWLAKIFPEARFVIIWRNPTAIIRSVTHAANKPSWFRRRGMFLRTLLGCRVLKTECSRLISAGLPVHQMEYEQITRDPVASMANLCKFLDVPFTAEITELEGADRSAIYNAEHHSLVHSEKIVSPMNRPEILPRKVREKIDSYVSLWLQESGGEWPKIDRPRGNSAARPSYLTRLIDRVLYSLLCIFDSAVVRLYCFIPLWILTKYRSLRGGYESKIQKTSDPQSLSAM